MDPETIGRLGGIAGGGIGVLGGLIGTYFTIKNTKSARERAFTIRASIVCWLLIIVFLAGIFLIPTWHKHLLWIPYTVLLIWGIRVWNKTQLRIRNEESSGTA